MKSKMECKFCNSKMSLSPIGSENFYCWCKNCKCSYFFHGEILIKLSINSLVHNETYTITINFVEQNSKLSKLGSQEDIIYSCDKCIDLTPQNVHDKIRTWLLMI